jgi:hypothetical protein
MHSAQQVRNDRRQAGSRVRKNRGRMSYLEALESRTLLSVTYSDASMNGPWLFHGESAFGTMNFNGLGLVNGGTLVGTNGLPTTPAGTYAVSATGGVTITVGTAATGEMNVTQDVVAVTKSQTDSLSVLVNNIGGVFSNADMAGTWTVVFNSDHPGSNGFGTLSFNAQGGLVSGTVTDGNGTHAVTSGSYAINADGTMATGRFRRLRWRGG